MVTKEYELYLKLIKELKNINPFELTLQEYKDMFERLEKEVTDCKD